MTNIMYFYNVVRDDCSSSVDESSSESRVSVDRAELESFSREENVRRSREKPTLLSVLGKNCFNFGRSVSLSDSSTFNGESCNIANVQAKEDEEERTVTVSKVKTFTGQELAAATKNFGPECLLCKGRTGHYYKGRLESTGQVVVVKKFDMDGFQGQREFLTKVLMLSHLHHPNIVNLIGHCADRYERLLAYEFMPLGSLKDHLHDLPPNKEPLDWTTRMKIAAGAARGLEYLHDRATPPVIYKNFKSSNILLDEGYHSKLSDFGLAKLGPNDETPLSTRVMGSYGYCAPEYAMTGQLSTKADIYSVGVVLLELITGRKAIDNTRSPGERHLVAWARPLFKDRRNCSRMADPLLQGCYPMRSLSQALAAAAMCLQKQAASRPPIADLVIALTSLASQGYDPDGSSTQNNRGAPSTCKENGNQNRQEEVGHVGRSHGSPSHHRQDSSAYKGGMGSGSGKKWSKDELGIPKNLNCDLDRE